MTTTDLALVTLLTTSYEALLGHPLLPPTSDPATGLYESPAAVLAHDTSPDPVFIYANRKAQHLFGYTWDTFIGLPSRLSAPPQDRASRDVLMKEVQTQGFTTGYSGPRVTSHGQQFLIGNVTIWNLTNPDGTPAGQAALIP